METIYQRVASLDIHKKTIVVCLRTTSSDGSVEEDIRTFATMTDDLLALGNWLFEQQVASRTPTSARNSVAWQGAAEERHAIIAVADSLLVVFYHLLEKTPLQYRELGGDYFDTRDPIQLRRHLVKRLESFGYEVTLVERQAA